MASSLQKTLRKRIEDAIWTTFAEAYHEADVYYEEDKLDKCLEKCQEIIGANSVPRYIKISTLILFALVVEGESNFRAARTEAGV